MTAVVIGVDGACSRRVSATLRREGWSVRRARRGVRVAAAVAIIDSDRAVRADEVVTGARAFGDPVIVVVSEPTADSVRALLEAGADAVLPEYGIDALLGVALRAALAGLVAAPREFRQGLDRPALTQREKQALSMVVLGFSNADIASRLYVAESTVKSHLSSAFAKLGVRSRSEATALILDRSHGVGTGILAIVGDGDAGGG